MTLKKTHFWSVLTGTLFLFALLAIDGREATAGDLDDPGDDVEAPLAADQTQPLDLRTRPEALTPSVQRLWSSYPNVCESFNMIQSTHRVKDSKGRWHYPINYRRNRYVRTEEDKARTRKLIELVAKEMGVKHPKFFAAFALHESTWNPEAIHILNPDREANQRAWKRHSYSRNKELQLEAALRRTNAQQKEYWSIKADLADVRLYKGNPHWNDHVAYSYVIPAHTGRDGKEVPKQSTDESRNVWSFGYGLYGMYAVGYVKIWDKQAPPWILCADEGIVATIIQVWAARNNTKECDSLTSKNPEKWGHDGGTYHGVLRRLARGKCSDDPLGPKWRQLMRTFSSVPWDSHADFGNKWPEYEMERRGGKWRYKRDAEGNKIPSSREAVLQHMLKRAEEEGLLRPAPLELKRPGTEPRVIPGNKPVKTAETSVDEAS